MTQNANLTTEYQSSRNGEVDCNYIEFIIPGAMFLFYGIWWILQLSRVYYHTRWKHIDFRSSLIYPCSKQGCKQSVQSWIQLILILIAISVIVTGTRHLDSQGKTNMQMMRTCIILSAFGVSCLVNITAQFFANSVPPGLDYCFFLFAFVVEGILFGHYVFNETESLSSAAENLVTYCAVITVIVTVLELHYQSHVIFPFLRAYVTFIQGTWLCHMAHIFCSPSRWETNTDNVEVVSIYFVVHSMTDFIAVCVIWLIVYRLALHDRCGCLPVNLDKSNEVFLENRVHFDYHILDRLGSDAD